MSLKPLEKSAGDVIKFLENYEQAERMAIDRVVKQVSCEMRVRKEMLLDQFIKGEGVNFHFKFTVEWDFEI